MMRDQLLDDSTTVADRSCAPLQLLEVESSLDRRFDDLEVRRYIEVARRKQTVMTDV
jgi:hypothetical protein